MSFLPFDLLRPEHWWAPVASVLIAVLGLWSLSVRRRGAERLVDLRQLRRFLPDYSRGRATVRALLAFAATGLVGFSLLGPVRGYTFRDVVGHGLDIVVCVDTSQSMLARDVKPNRLERAKREVAGLLDTLRGDRVAVIAFSGEAREIAPLTHDKRTLKKLVEPVGPEDNRMGGTDLASALERALAMFDGRTGAYEVIALLTDGEDLAGEAARMAAEARDRGIRVYVVGVGKASGGKIPIVGPDGTESFLLDKEGEEVVTRMDRTSLERIAETTGGAFLTVEEHPTPLEELYVKRISRLEGRELVGGKQRVPHDRYQWALALALACMVCEVGLRERRRA